MAKNQVVVELEKKVDYLSKELDIHIRREMKFKRFATVMEESSDAIIVIDLHGEIQEWNKGAVKMYGWPKEEAVTFHISKIIPPEKESEFVTLINDISHNKRIDSFETRRLSADGLLLDVWVNATPLFNSENGPVALAMIERNISQHKQEEKEKANLIIQLQKALAEVKTLRGIIPICMFCKQIRDDKGYWEQVEVYVHKHSHAHFSHGICPSCLKIKYPKLYEKKLLLERP